MNNGLIVFKLAMKLRKQASKMDDPEKSLLLAKAQVLEDTYKSLGTNVNITMTAAYRDADRYLHACFSKTA